MERLQGPINPCQYIGEHLDVNLECCSLGQGFVNTQEEEGEDLDSSYFSATGFLLEDKMPFLQMLQSVELPPFFPLKEPSFQALLKLQHLKRPCWGDISPSIDALESETVVSSSHDMVDPLRSSSPVKSEIFDLQNPNPPSSSCLGGPEGTVSPSTTGPSISQEQVPSSLQEPSHCTDETLQVQPTWCHPTHVITKPLCHPAHVITKPSPPACTTREKRKRKRIRPAKNKEEVESQRMTHIEVERNRRRLMNEHLSSLRALMPPSYVQRGDQASIIGGAIDFVKELEQLLQSLEAQKRIRRTEGVAAAAASASNSTALFTPGVSHFCPVNSQRQVNGQEQGAAAQVRQRSEVAEIEVTVIQNHVNLKVNCQRRPSQLLRAIVALEELRFTVLHLNITSTYTRVFYTFNLKIEEECKLGSADEVAGAVHQIFSVINGS